MIVGIAKWLLIISILIDGIFSLKTFVYFTTSVRTNIAQQQQQQQQQQHENPRFTVSSIQKQLDNLIISSRCRYLSKSSNNDNTILEAMSPEKCIAILDRSLRQHTSFGILDQIQKWLTSAKDKSLDGNQLSNLSDMHTTLRFALLSHGKDEGTIDGGVHNYANFGALSAFRAKKELFMQIPARRMANVGPHQYELEDMLLSLQNHKEYGREVIDEYNGFRCTIDQDIFYIRKGLVWNCYDDDGEYFGQATLFDRELIDFM